MPRAALWGIAARVVAPAVVAIVCLADRAWYPTDDLAIIDARVRDVLVRPYGSTLASVFDGVVNWLDRAGVRVRVDHPLGREFGDQRVGTAAHADEVWYVTEEGSLRQDLMKLPGARLVTFTDPLSYRDSVSLSLMQNQLIAQLRAVQQYRARYYADSGLIAIVTPFVPSVGQRLVRRVTALNAKAAHDGGCRCSIVAVSGAARFSNPPRVLVHPD